MFGCYRGETADAPGTSPEQVTLSQLQCDGPPDQQDRSTRLPFQPCGEMCLRAHRTHA